MGDCVGVIRFPRRTRRSWVPQRLGHPKQRHEPRPTVSSNTYAPCDRSILVRGGSAGWDPDLIASVVDNLSPVPSKRWPARISSTWRSREHAFYQHLQKHLGPAAYRGVCLAIFNAQVRAAKADPGPSDR